MKCPVQAGGNADILLDYCAHTLDGESVALLEIHMVDCPDCRAFRDIQSEIWSSLDDWETLPISSDFNRRLYSRIEAEEQKPWWRQWRTVWTALHVEPAMPIAAAALLVLAALLFQATSPAPTMPEEHARAEMKADLADIEQAARELEDMDMLQVLPALLAAEETGQSNSI